MKIPDPDFEAYYRQKMTEIALECQSRGVPESLFIYNMVVTGLTALKLEVGEIGYHDIREEIESIVDSRARRGVMVN